MVLLDENNQATAAQVANLSHMVLQYKAYLERTLEEKRSYLLAANISSVEGIVERVQAIHTELTNYKNNSSQISEQLLNGYVQELTGLRNKATTLLQVAAVAFPGFFNSKYSNAFEIVSQIRRNTTLVKVRYCTTSKFIN